MTANGPADRHEHARLCRAAATDHDRHLLGGLERFVLFVGQSRSGHSVVGTLLNAHRNAVVAHGLDVLDFARQGVSREDLLLLILERDRWLGKRERQIGGYSYNIPNLWLGEQNAIRVIGDKRAGSSSRYIAAAPSLLQKLRDELQMPLCIIHHVRNPWDNISSIWSRKTMNTKRSLPETIAHYFDMIEGAALAITNAPTDTCWQRTFHEQMISDPRQTLRELCKRLGLATDPEYLDACADFVHPNPRQTRHAAPWTNALIEQVAEQASHYDFLAHYRFTD